MPNPATCAALSTNVITKTGATTAPLWIAAILDAANDTTDDTGRTIPANALWTTTALLDSATSTIQEGIMFVPAVTSPIYGKCIILVIWAATGTHTGTTAPVMKYDTYANGKLMIGMYLANTGSTVTTAEYKAWDQYITSGGPFTNANGIFTGYIACTASATPSQAIYWSTSDTLCFDVQLAANTLSRCYGGMMIKGLSDSANEGESGLLGGLFAYGTSGPSTMDSGMISGNIAANSGIMLGNGTNGGYSHFLYRQPGTSTITGCGMANQDSHIGSYMATNDDDNMLGVDGSIRPREVVIHRHSDNRTLGDMRTHFFGPRRYNKSVLTETGTGTKKWIACSSVVSGSGDAFCCPI